MRRRLRAWAVAATELLDDPAADPRDVARSLHDIARINRRFGGTAAAAGRLEEFLPPAGGPACLSLLDVGSGLGDIPREVAARAERRGIRLRLVGLERHPVAARLLARAGGLATLVADGACLPFRSGSVDLVLCVKVMHHLREDARLRLLREMDRVARGAVVVADIRRSALAALGIWLASFPMRLHPATRRDGVISVLRSFSPAELAGACAAAGVAARVKRHPLWCLTAAWRPGRRAAPAGRPA